MVKTLACALALALFGCSSATTINNGPAHHDAPPDPCDEYANDAGFTFTFHDALSGSELGTCPANAAADAGWCCSPLGDAGNFSCLCVLPQ